MTLNITDSEFVTTNKSSIFDEFHKVEPFGTYNAKTIPLHDILKKKQKLFTIRT